ncbi:hypothetical protein RRG08_036599 [Elysia crispata]|uniref:Uncharacterized protein n=1 Tax=Elysia crispata TaxID=231223 RepID=A0AAE1DKB9_9GAST|nr:hypothetical protein RRG08_036599 [Elysia crispata]
MVAVEEVVTVSRQNPRPACIDLQTTARAASLMPAPGIRRLIFPDDGERNSTRLLHRIAPDHNTTDRYRGKVTGLGICDIHSLRSELLTGIEGKSQGWESAIFIVSDQNF